MTEDLEPTNVNRQRTWVIATLGPASDDPQDIRRLVRGGIDVARLNRSHGSRAESTRRLATVRF